MTDNQFNGIIPPDELPLEFQKRIVIDNNRNEALRTRLYFETEYKVAVIVKDEAAKTAAKEGLKKCLERLQAIDDIIADIDHQIVARDIALKLSQEPKVVLAKHYTDRVPPDQWPEEYDESPEGEPLTKYS